MTTTENRTARWPQYGPWAAVDAAERTAACRELRALALLLCGELHPFTTALAEAIADPAALDRAAVALAKLPALQRRRVLGAYAALIRPPKAH